MKFNFDEFNSNNSNKNIKFLHMYVGNNEIIKFGFNSLENLNCCNVHIISNNDKTKYIKCTGNDCPLCKRGYPKQLRLFIPLYVLKNNLSTPYIFERTATEYEINRLQRLTSSFDSLSDEVFMLKRESTYKYTYEKLNNLNYIDKFPKDFTIFNEFNYDNIYKPLTEEEINNILN